MGSCTGLGSTDGTDFTTCGTLLTLLEELLLESESQEKYSDDSDLLYLVSDLVVFDFFIS